MLTEFIYYCENVGWDYAISELEKNILPKGVAENIDNYWNAYRHLDTDAYLKQDWDTGLCYEDRLTAINNITEILKKGGE